MKRYLVIIADLDEFNPFSTGLKDYEPHEESFYGMPAVKFEIDGNDVLAVCCGIGKVNAAIGVTLALAAEDFDGVVNLGYSGAISALSMGDIVAGSSFTECDFDLSPLGYAPAEKPYHQQTVFYADKCLFDAAMRIPDMKSGVLGTGDFFLADKAKKQQYKELFSINAFDMESGAAAAACYVMHVPFISIRKISDSADDVAHTDYRGTLSPSDMAFSDMFVKLLKNLN